MPHGRVTTLADELETEAGFMGWVLEVARLHGWRVAHFGAAVTEKGWRTPVRADAEGFPDLLLLRHDRAVVAELKSERGRREIERARGTTSLRHRARERLQLDWLDAFAAARIETYLWSPRDRADIAACLR